MTRTPLLDRIASPADLRALPVKELEKLAKEVRAELLAITSANGGHLGSNLGVVELTIALHRAFETPDDRIVFDVGHQCYVHKLLTGRRAAMQKVRQAGGATGFTTRLEGEHDPFGAAHSSTSISAALGFAKARDLKGENRKVVVVIGDSAITGGMAYEALNNAGGLKAGMIVILNDNGMSIAPPTGALADALESEPAKAWRLFEGLGFTVQGPVDGHDLDALDKALTAAKHASRGGPVLLHVKTVKGRGYAPAESSRERHHGVTPFDPATGIAIPARPAAPTYTRVFAQALEAEAARDSSIIAITAAMPSGTGLEGFAKAHPNRFFDVGIAEQHAVTFAAALACEGLKPFCAIYSTFLQRAYDQIVHDVALQNLPVRFAIDRAGLVGADGATHAGAFDIAYLACLPNMVVMAAGDEADLARMVATAADYSAGPIAFRYPRGEGLGVVPPAKRETIPIGKGRVLREGADIALVSFGARLGDTLAAADHLQRAGIRATVADARFAKPLDEPLLLALAARHQAIITIEEGASGGFGAAVQRVLSEAGVFDDGYLFRSLTLPDRFQPQDTPAAQLAAAGLDAAGIAAAAIRLWNCSERRHRSVPSAAAGRVLAEVLHRPG